MVRWYLMLLVLAGLAFSPEVRAAEGEFRCDSEVFVGEEKEPVQETLTIFTGALAYDFLLGTPEEITVYDFGRREVKLLDKARKVRTLIALDDVLRFTAAYKTAKAESELFAFCIEPSFVEEFADDTLALRGRQLTYEVQCGKPGFEGAEKRYRQFADWSAQLNAMRPRNLPPFPRMELNKALAARGALPAEITRTIVTSTLTGKRTDIVRSRHLFNWTLSSQDRRKIDDVGDYLSDFTAVSPEEYLEIGKQGKTASR